MTSVVLKALRPTDFGNYWPLISDDMLAQQAGFLAVQDELAGQMMFGAALQRQMTYLIWLDDQVVGSVAFERLDDEDTKLEIGYMVLPAFWGQGIAQQAVLQAQIIAQTKLACIDLYAFVVPDNHASIAVLDKAGFQRLTNSSGYHAGQISYYKRLV